MTATPIDVTAGQVGANTVSLHSTIGSGRVFFILHDQCAEGGMFYLFK